MIRFILIVAFLIGIPLAGWAQPKTGLRFDAVSFDSIPVLPTYTGVKEMLNMPKTADLTRYCPVPIDQGNDQTCVAFATAYAAYAIQQAAASAMKGTSKEITNRFSLSPIFPLLKLKYPCWEGIHLQAIGKFMVQHTSLRFRDYQVISCNSALLPKAQPVPPISDIVRIFSRDNASDEKITLTKRQLTHLNPIIVGLNVYKNFFNLNSGFYVPATKGNEPSTPHAMVVVAYDDRREAFKIMNSFGPNWGENGFFWIKYLDFDRDAVAGFSLVLNENDMVAGASKPLKVDGQFGIRAVYEEADTLRYDTLQTQHTGQGIYRLIRQSWSAGQAFQLLTENTQANEYMCVFSLDPTNKLTAHFPRNRALTSYNSALSGNNESDLLPFDGFDAIIPDQETALTLDKTGTNYLCVLYSRRPLLPDLPDILQRINAGGTISERLVNGLGKRLLTSRIAYESNRMQFVAQTLADADTVALILELQATAK